MDQEFSERGPSQGSGTKQNEANSEAECEISVYTCAIFNVFLYKIQDIMNTGAELVRYFCANTKLKTFNGG